MFNFEKLPKLVNLRGKTKHNGWYKVYDPSVKTDIAIHHSLTKTGNSVAFANYHVGTLGWPEVAYHFVILKDGTIEWNHDLGVLSYHVGDSNKFSLGICLVGDFRSEEPTKEQKESLYALHEALKKDLPNYKRTRGHNEFPGYAWKECPAFDYKAVIEPKPVFEITSVPASEYVGRKLIVKTEGLPFYDEPRWDKSAGKSGAGHTFIITEELIVEGARMLRCHDGKYRTADPAHVTVTPKPSDWPYSVSIDGVTHAEAAEIVAYIGAKYKNAKAEGKTK